MRRARRRKSAAAGAVADEERMAIQPIFVFSITRSGSTLVQRVIGGHQGVATVSEPWLLLPYLYTLRRDGVEAEYTHRLMVTAIEDFCSELPGGSETYRRELREFVLRLYEQAAGPEACYFLDKSPPYYFIAEEIMRLFPEGKFVFLWRNPLSIIASIIETWQSGRWSPTMFRQDLFVGLPRLVSAYEENQNRAYSVRFEDLLSDGELPWRGLMEHLGIEFDPQALAGFSQVMLNGRTGDKTGSRRYSELSTEPTQKWAQTIANPVRRAWCRRYLRFLGNDRLGVMGYDGDALIDELDSQPRRTASMLPDVANLVNDLVREPVRVRIRRQGAGGPNPIRHLFHTHGAPARASFRRELPLLGGGTRPADAALAAHPGGSAADPAGRGDHPGVQPRGDAEAGAGERVLAGARAAR
jgi:Sulfotransferase family